MRAFQADFVGVLSQSSVLEAEVGEVVFGRGGGGGSQGNGAGAGEQAGMPGSGVAGDRAAEPDSFEDLGACSCGGGRMHLTKCAGSPPRLDFFLGGWGGVGWGRG